MPLKDGLIYCRAMIEVVCERCMNIRKCRIIFRADLINRFPNSLVPNDNVLDCDTMSRYSGLP